MTDTDWLALADFLDAHANDMRAWTEDEPKFRATAEGLRQLAAITAERDQLRAERTQLTGDSMTDLKMTYAYEAGHEDGKAEVREQLAAITVAIGDPDDASVMCPPEIRPDSWLHDDRHDGVAEFRSALDYARTQTRFIQAAAGVKPEALFYIWSLLNRGARNAAASLSPTPTPDRCPTCGSRSREMAVTGSACDPWTGSPDAWHDSGQP